MKRVKAIAVRTGLAPKKCPIRGVFFHKASGQYISYIGYHEKVIKDRHGKDEQSRVRSTQYLGSDETQAIAKYFQFKATWKNIVAAERKRFEDRQSWMRQNHLAVGYERFKPTWPHQHGGTEAEVQPWSQTVAQVADNIKEMKGDNPMLLNLVDARDKYLATYKGKIGLLNGQGINEYTYHHYAGNLNLALGLNPQYKRDRKPIDTSKSFEELKFEDYQAYIRFWCDPTVVKSGRTGLNYIRAFKQMLDGLRIKLPEGAAELFELRITVPPKIARYNAEHLKAVKPARSRR